MKRIVKKLVAVVMALAVTGGLWGTAPIETKAYVSVGDNGITINLKLDAIKAMIKEHENDMAWWQDEYGDWYTGLKWENGYDEPTNDQAFELLKQLTELPSGLNLDNVMRIQIRLVQLEKVQGAPGYVPVAPYEPGESADKNGYYGFSYTMMLKVGARYAADIQSLSHFNATSIYTYQGVMDIDTWENIFLLGSYDDVFRDPQPAHEHEWIWTIDGDHEICHCKGCPIVAIDAVNQMKPLNDKDVYVEMYWNSLPAWLMEEIKESGKKTTFHYWHRGYEVTIEVPAGEVLVTGVEWYGPEYLADHYRAYTTVKNQSGPASIDVLFGNN